MRWVVEGVLARSSRPAYWDDPTLELVSKWLDQALQMRIKTIICLLSDSEIQEYYRSRGIDLLQEYRLRDLEVLHLPAADHQTPPLNAKQIAELDRLFSQAQRPILVHCSAGIDRTGTAIDHLRRINSL